MGLHEPEFPKFVSRYDFSPFGPTDLLRVPELYALRFESDTDRDDCYSIYRELSHNLRERMKPSHQLTA